jgi:thioesterase domain-containing protein
LRRNGKYSLSPIYKEGNVSPLELEQYLHCHIPLSKAMAVSVVSVDPDVVVLKAPLAPNINHRETVFGGSASALAILSAWSLVHIRLRNEGCNGRLVIQRNVIEYEKPISGEFTARSRLEHAEDWGKFIRMFTRKGKARVTITSELAYAGQRAARLTGEFVVLSLQNV